MKEDSPQGFSLNLIAAMDRHRVIGRDGDLPWRLPNDLKHFKRLTEGRIVLMGRKTWVSLGRPLPNRDNWVLTRDPAYVAEGARVFNRLDDTLAALEGRDAMVIGGAQIYRQTLPLARRLYLTEVDAEVEGDTRFPEFDSGQWRERDRQTRPADEHHDHSYSFVELVRV